MISNIIVNFYKVSETWLYLWNKVKINEKSSYFRWSFAGCTSALLLKKKILMSL